ncbi:hypothetical protein PIB30_014689 [Stylosanthes scabra]|uniref:Glycosyl transferase 64 domain-containing protein n=1 Tax=Stylosanthes scabra TaxID=79078 RepID=A0ABU6U7U5_9FABA|nr:hypothetical protein [Stylosanthes scabra]
MPTPPIPPILTVIAIFFLSLTPASQSPDTCSQAKIRDPQSLRRDQITVVMNGFSEERIPLLQSLATAYSLSTLVSSVLVLWGNPSTPPRVLHQLARNLSSSSDGSITLLPQPSSSLNLRFLPRPNHIKTEAVLICDDDVEVHLQTLEFAFRIWSSNQDRIVGLFARSHDFDLNRKEWVYTVQPDRFSIMLTKFMLLKSEYLYHYTCGGGKKMTSMRRLVDSVRNCEDILMNIVVSEVAKVGPVLVGARRVRDYGDARNDEGGEGYGGGGLSGRKGEHRMRRGWCITEFHRVLGRMPLRYSYGKVVDSVGEQALCNKRGKLVYCDHSFLDN